MGPVRGFENVRTAVALTLALSVGGAACGGGAETDSGNRNEEARTTIDAGVATPEQVEACADTFPMPGLPENEKAQILLGGQPELANATNEEEARDALAGWSAVISSDDGVLAGYARQILEKEVPKDELVDAEGCATALADDVRTAIEIELGEAEVSDGSVPAPANTLNSGFNGEDIVVARQVGVSGNTLGITFTLDDGRKFHTLGRCSNLGVVSGPVYLPPGKTDEPEPTPGVTPKNNTGSAAGVPGANRGSQTTEERGPRGPGVGSINQPIDGRGRVEGEVVVPAPPEATTHTDPDNETAPRPNDGASEGDPAGNGSPEVTVVAPGTQDGEHGGGAGSQNGI